MNADASVFFALWLQKPLQIAAARSSRRRSRALHRLGSAGPRSRTRRRHGQSDTGPSPRRLFARAHHRARARASPGRCTAPGISDDDGHRRRCDADPRTSRRRRRAACRRCLQPADKVVSGCCAKRCRQALPRSSRTGRLLPSAYQCLLFAPASRPLKNQRAGGRSRLAQPAADADLGLLGPFPSFGDGAAR